MDSAQTREESGRRPASSTRRRTMSDTSLRSVKTRKSMVSNVFRGTPLVGARESVAQRLGRHMQVEAYTSEGVLLDEAEKKKRAKRAKRKLAEPSVAIGLRKLVWGKEEQRGS